jgi:hypothetical protein
VLWVDGNGKELYIGFIEKCIYYACHAVAHDRTNALAGGEEKVRNVYASLKLPFADGISELIDEDKRPNFVVAGVRNRGIPGTEVRQGLKRGRMVALFKRKKEDQPGQQGSNHGQNPLIFKHGNKSMMEFV